MLSNEIIDFILKEARINKKAIEFSNQDAYNEYMKEHPDANPKNHSIKNQDKSNLEKKIDNKKENLKVEEKVENLNKRLKKWGWDENSKAYQAVNNPKNYLDSLLGEHEILEAEQIDEIGYEKSHDLAVKEQIKSIKESGLLSYTDYSDKDILKGWSAILDELHPIWNTGNKKYKPTGKSKEVFNDLLNGLYKEPTYKKLSEFYTKPHLKVK